jgi:hypothetical protein
LLATTADLNGMPVNAVGAGLVNLLKAANAVPTTLSVGGPPTAVLGQPAVLTAAVNLISATFPITYSWQSPDASPVSVVGGATATASLTWATIGPKVVTVTAMSRFNTITATRTISVVEPAPMLSAISPVTATAGGPPFVLTVSGSGFINGTSVLWNGAVLTTTDVSPTQLTAVVPAANISVTGVVSVSATTPGPGGGVSGVLPFTVLNPVPTITAFSPPNALAGSPDVTLTITGTGFVSGTVVLWNGAPLTTTFLSPTKLTAVVPAAFLGGVGSFSVTVSNPGPGGGVAPSALLIDVKPPNVNLPVAANFYQSSW